MLHAEDALREGLAMVVAAHPDDETIGAGAVLGHLPGASVVHVTDGAPRDPRYFATGYEGTREDYAALRRGELLAAMSLAGVEPARLRGVGVAD